MSDAFSYVFRNLNIPGFSEVKTLNGILDLLGISCGITSDKLRVQALSTLARDHELTRIFYHEPTHSGQIPTALFVHDTAGWDSPECANVQVVRNNVQVASISRLGYQWKVLDMSSSAKEVARFYDLERAVQYVALCPDHFPTATMPPWL